jgi:hypothetical protein
VTTFARHTIAREAVANVLAHRLLSAIVVAIAAIVPLCAISIGILDTAAIGARDQQLIDRGSHVFVVTAVDRAELPAARCDELNSVSGVGSAGAIVDVEQAHARLPDFRYLALASVTPGLPAIYWPRGVTAADAGVTAGASVAEDLGLVPGALLPVAVGGEPRDLPIAVVSEPSPRAQQHDLALVQVVPPAGVTLECLVEARPGAARAVEAALIGWFPGVTTTVTPFLAAPDTGRTPQQEFDARLSLWLPVAAGALVALVVLAWWTIRRAEFALYAVMGLRPAGLALMLAIEWAVLCLLPAAVGITNALGATAGWLGSATVVEATALDVWRYLATITVIPAVGCLAIVRASAFDSLKGR